MTGKELGQQGVGWGKRMQRCGWVESRVLLTHQEDVAFPFSDSMGTAGLVADKDTVCLHF